MTPHTTLTHLHIRKAHYGVAAIFFLNGALFGAWASRIPTVKQDLGLNEATLGMLLLLLAAGAITSFPIAGFASDNFGAQRTTKALAVMNIVALLVISLISNIWLLVPALFLFGTTHGGIDVAMNTWGAQLEKMRERPTMSGLHAMWSIGTGVGAGSGALALAFNLGIVVHFFSFSLILGAAALWLADTPWPGFKNMHQTQKKFFAVPKGALAFVGLIAFCSAMSEGAIADWSAVYLVQILTASAANAPVGYAAFSITMVLTRLSGDRIISGLGYKRTAQLSGLIATVGAVTVIFAPHVLVAWLGFALMGIGYATIFPMVFSRAANDPEMTPGAAMAATATFGYGGLLLGPPIIGFIAQASTLQWSFGLLAILPMAIFTLAPAMKIVTDNS